MPLFWEYSLVVLLDDEWTSSCRDSYNNLFTCQLSENSCFRDRNCKTCPTWRREREREQSWLYSWTSAASAAGVITVSPRSRCLGKHTVLLSRLASLIPNLRPFKQMSNYRRNKGGGGESERERVRYRSYDEKGKERNKEREGEHKHR